MKSMRIFNMLFLSILVSVSAIFMANTVRHEDSEASFKRFVALFPTREMPYKVGASEMNAWIERRKTKTNAAEAHAKPQKQAAISEEFNDYIPELNGGRFSRMGPDIFTPEAVLAQNSKQTILIYSRSRGYSERKGSQYLAVFSPKGKRLSEMLIAKSDGYEGFMGCKISQTANGSLLVTTTQYTNQWKSDKARYDDDNFITAVTPKRSTSYALAADGEMEEIAMP